jgi:replicative DNA helicase
MDRFANKEAESWVIASLLEDRNSYSAAAAFIKSPNYFYYSITRLIWYAWSELFLEEKPFEEVLIIEKLDKEIKQGLINWSDITDMIKAVPTSQSCKYYAEIVEKNYIKRELYRLNYQSMEALEFNEPIDIWKNFNDKSSKLFIPKNDEYSIHDLMNELESIDENKSWGINWGLPELDNFETGLGPIAKGSIIVIGGRPGHGKTAIALQLMDGWAKRGHKIFFQSLEMTKRELDQRRLSRFSGIPLWKLRRGPSNYDRVLANNGAAKIYEREKNFFVSDTSGLTPEQIALNIQTAYEQHGIDIFVLDHFHRIRFHGSDNRHSMEQGLENILSVCKNKGIMPIILSQLNRAIENYETEREPRLSDIRECGRLEEAATNVLFIYWKYKRTMLEEDKYKIKLLCAKARDGKTGRIELPFTPEIYTFGKQQ